MISIFKIIRDGKKSFSFHSSDWSHSSMYRIETLKNSNLFLESTNLVSDVCSRSGFQNFFLFQSNEFHFRLCFSYSISLDFAPTITEIVWRRRKKILKIKKRKKKHSHRVRSYSDWIEDVEDSMIVMIVPWRAVKSIIFDVFILTKMMRIDEISFSLETLETVTTTSPHKNCQKKIELELGITS